MLHFAYSAVNPVSVKSLMQAVGLPAGPLRRPLQPMQGAALRKGIDALVASGAAAKYDYKIDMSRIAAE